jgi:dihydroflavonol-4-reductase
MTDPGSVDQALRGCDGVVHVAALVDLRRAAARLVETTNARGTELVVGGAARRGLASIVYVSTLGVFFVPGGPPLTPELPIVPGTTAYARSKSRAEQYVRRLQEEGAPIRISYPAAISGPDDPALSEVNTGIVSFLRAVWLITSTGCQTVDVRDLAALHVKLLELPDGAHRYAAAADMVSWAAYHRLAVDLIGHPIRHITVPGWLLRAAGSAGDVVKRVHDFDFPLTRDSMEFTTQWPGADAGRTTRELGIQFRAGKDTLRDTLTWMHQAGHLTAAQVGRLAQPVARA